MSKFYNRPFLEDGVIEITLQNWPEFFEFCDFYFSNDMGMYFRGQRDSSWGLNTTLDRYAKSLDQRASGTYDWILKSFSKSIMGKTSAPKDIYKNEDEIWALGQHNGLAMPFLDWTAAAYVALFFAFENEAPSTTGYRTVFGIHKFIKYKMDEFNHEKNREDEFKFVDVITDHNPRLVSQSGIFTKQPINFDFEEWVKIYWKGVSDRPVMFKVHIPDGERPRILKSLRLMNITHATIYPDLHGAAKGTMAELQLISHKASMMTDAQLIEHSTYEL